MLPSRGDDLTEDSTDHVSRDPFHDEERVRKPRSFGRVSETDG
jgi:hypothetical protein